MYPILDTRVECKENGDFNGFDWMGNLNIIRLECKVICQYEYYFLNII